MKVDWKTTACKKFALSPELNSNCNMRTLQSGQVKKKL